MVKHTQTICQLLPLNYLCVFDHFVEVALKRVNFQEPVKLAVYGFFWDTLCASIFHCSPRIKYSSQIPDRIHRSGIDLLSRVRYLDMTVVKLRRSQQIKEMTLKNNWTSCKKNCKFSSVYFVFTQLLGKNSCKSFLNKLTLLIILVFWRFQGV